MESIKGTIRHVSDAESRAMGPGKQRLHEGRHGGKQPELGTVKPPEVEKAVEREVEDMAAQGRPVVGEARERLLEGFKLRYYFGGQPFAYRETDLGKEILAVGFKSMRRLFGEMAPEEDEAIISGFAEPW
jgi:hypothetical protein